jgi:hypothetical protein
MTTRYHVAVRRPDGDDAVLVLADGSMPGFRMDAPPWWQIVSPVVERMRDDLGLDVVVLRAAWLGEPVPGADAPDRLYEAVHQGGRMPPGARWIALDALPRRPTPLGRAIDDGALDAIEGDRQPWYRAGWHADMVAWIDDQTGRAGLRRRGPIRQVRSWGRSALLTVETDRGRLWAKQVPAVFAHEVAVTGLLADVDPGIVPPLVAADPASGRLLMEDVVGPILASEPAASDAWLATMARLAEIQRVLSADLGSARVAGVPGTPVEALAEVVPGLLADGDLGLVGRAGGLTVLEHEALVAAGALLQDACAALAASAVGPSVEHGDLSASQVIVGEMGPVFLDWSDATRTHPFLAAASFLMETSDLPADLLPRLEDAYLGGWPGVGGRESLGRDLELARVVHPLHMAQLYRERILPGLEQRWEMDRMAPGFLRSLLPRLAGLPRILDA